MISQFSTLTQGSTFNLATFNNFIFPGLELSVFFKDMIPGHDCFL
jgi:hypothetical protein